MNTCSECGDCACGHVHCAEMIDLRKERDALRAERDEARRLAADNLANGDAILDTLEKERARATRLAALLGMFVERHRQCPLCPVPDPMHAAHPVWCKFGAALREEPPEAKEED